MLRIPMGNAVGRRLGTHRGMATLIAISLAMVVGISTILYGLSERQAEIRASIREDALWAAYQLDRETTKLLGTLYAARLAADKESIDELVLRFDILVSRVHVFEEGNFRTYVVGGGSLEADLSTVHNHVEALTPAFNRIGGLGASDPGTLDMLVTELTKLRTITERILLTINRRQIAAGVAERDSARHDYIMIAAAVIVIAIALGGVIIILMRQLREIERSRHELQLLSEKHARAAEEAESGNRAKTTFLATMSHEIRTPLNGIMGSAELLDLSNLSTEQRAHLDTINECGNALTAIISDLLDFSKIEAGALDLEKREFTLTKLVDGVLDIVSPRARMKDIGLVALYPSATVEGDLARLRQILLNLAGNAVKFTDKGDVVIEADVTYASDGASVLRFTVSDTGIGISPAARERLFREFSQGDASITRRFGGSGLGLAISARLVAAMGGKIGVVSEAGRGSQFWFTVPIKYRADDAVIHDEITGRSLRVGAATALAQEALERSLARAIVSEDVAADEGLGPLLLMDARRVHGLTGPDDALRQAIVYGSHASVYAGVARAVVEGPLTLQRLAAALSTAVPDGSDATSMAPVIERYKGVVLIVEDNAVNQKVAAGLLEKMGLTVDIAGDGMAAIARAAKGGIDLILMDMQMPHMDGLEATRRIRLLKGDAGKVTIVGLTANAFASDRDDCLRAGMNGFFTKPINREKLREIMRDWLPSRPQTPHEGGDQFAEARMIVALAEAVGVSPNLRHEAADELAGHAPDEDLIDRVQQRGLVEELGQETLDQLTDSFWVDLETLLASAEDPSSDSKTVRRALHTIKGTAESVGFRGVATACERVRETFLASGSISTVPIRNIAQKTKDAAKGPAGGIQKAA